MSDRLLPEPPLVRVSQQLPPPPPPLPSLPPIRLAPPPPPPPPVPPQPASDAHLVMYGGRSVLPPGATLSSRGKRFVALVLDVVLLFVTLVVGYIVWLLIAWGRGQTPAKQLLRMYVLDLERGRRATRGKMFRRWFVSNLLGTIIPWLGLVDALWIFSNQKNQRLTDKIVHTIVVDDTSRDRRKDRSR